ncbi:siderophore iron transporter [Purpureocillium lavendulum]|uniref:Siderophore iron transporter n=1 Tax=Purpureocillium lavendulum TaxID=1247861 RepID=A0AB34FEI9_9HYPO|nr:siderophore iron transporter [Purpureocillium lavendulum]
MELTEETLTMGAAADNSSGEHKFEHDIMADSKPTVEQLTPSASAAESEPRPRLHAKTFFAVAAVCLIYFAQLTVLLVNTPGLCGNFPLTVFLQQGVTIAGHFNESGKVSWLTAPITILTVVMCPVVSQACDYFGRKWFLTLLTFLGAVGCVIVSRATTMNMAIAGMGVVGISFGTQPLLHAVVSEVLPRRWRGYGQGAAAACNSLGCVLGLIVGAVLNRTNDPTKEGFRYYFYMGMAVHVLASLLCLVGYNPPPTQKQREYSGRTMDKLKMLDWVGYVLMAAGLTIFCLALSWSQNPYPWSDPHVCATFAVGIAFMVALVVYETYFKKDGMFDHGLFSMNRNYAICLFCVFTDGIAFFAANIYFAFEVNVVYETDALLINTNFVVCFVSVVVGAMLTGLWCAKFRSGRWITVAALTLMVIFFAVMAKTDQSTRQAVWGYPVLLGFALGMSITSIVTLAQLSTPVGLIALASGLIISIRSVGATVGIAIYNALFVAELAHMGENIANAIIPMGLNPEDVGAFIGALNTRNETAIVMIPNVTGPMIEAGVDALVNTYLSGFHHVWIAGACFAAVAAISACFLYDPVKEFNFHVDAPMEETNEKDVI